MKKKSVSRDGAAILICYPVRQGEKGFLQLLDETTSKNVFTHRQQQRCLRHDIK
jgi:hypothetical protein